MGTQHKNTKAAVLVGLLIALLSFAIFSIGVGVLLGTPLLPGNYLAMAILGLLIGSVAFLFLFFKLYYAFGSFMAGFVVGSILMLSTFWKGVAGWEDLIGLLSFLMFLAIGLGAGLLAQLIVFLVKKSRKT